MAGPKVVSALLTLAIFAFVEILAIQNDQTRSRASSKDDVILSTSSYNERTSDERQERGFNTERLQRTRDALRLETSKSFLDDFDLAPDETQRHPTSSTSSDDDSTSLDDALTSSSKLIAEQIDGNQIEVKPGEYYRSIVPTKSESLSGEGQGAPEGRHRQVGLWSEPREQKQKEKKEEVRVSQMQPSRQGRREPARIYSEHAPPPALARGQENGRQANPDIQDIVTGIFKLLNGKVNVAVNSARPAKPVQSTRINNRGPPRISDLPPLPPDFDTQGMNPPPPPPDQPSTYETPPAPSAPSINQLPPELPMTPFLNGIPIPEVIVPHGSRPWNRPSRPGGSRRPVPPYKPLPPMNSSFIPDREQPELDKTNAVIDLHDPINKIDPDENRTRITDVTKGTSSDHANHSQLGIRDSATAAQRPRPHATPTRKYQSTLKTDHAIADNTLVLGGIPPQPLPIPNSNETDELEPKPVVPLKGDAGSRGEDKIKNTKGSSSTTSSKAIFQTTLDVEKSSMVRVIETTSSTPILESSIVPTMHSDFADSSTSTVASTTHSSIPTSTSAVTLEPSRSSTIVADLSSSLSTPTEGLTSNLFVKTSSLSHKPAGQPFTSSVTFSKSQSSVYTYRPRPGIVLDDTLDYAGSQGLITKRPYEPPRNPSHPDTFDVVVTAIQGPGGSGTGEVRIPVNGHGGSIDILTSPIEGHDFVSIDGKRTYLNIFDNTEESTAPSKVHVQPTKTQSSPIHGTGFAVPQTETPSISARPNAPGVRRPAFPTQPPVRIDTCIVGDSSICDASQHEACATVQGVSACHCKPGFARLTHSFPCKRIVSIVVSIRVDKIYDRKIVWNKDLGSKDSEFYQTLAYEAKGAIKSAMSMTPFSDEYVDSFINNVYQGDVSQGQGGVFVNATLKLAYEPRTARQSLAGELQKHLLGVIQRRYNNIGNSKLHVDSPAGSISNLQDLDECASSELNDCHPSATCTNTWGGFACNCNAGLKDPHKGDQTTAGRTCLSCPTTHCNNRGTCSYQGDQMQCSCTGNYYGAQCEVDGEVLGVAIGASVAALIIIVLTLVCLVMWSRRWSREQKAISPVYGYIQGGLPGTLPARVGSVGTLASVKQGPPMNLPPYMWPQIADHLATANVYASEPMGPTRPSSAMFGYPTMSLHGTLPPVPLPRLQAPPRARQRHQPDPDSSDSEPQDKDRADLIPQSSFQVPRPKSRSSLANQSGIYYDVEYDQGDARHLSKNNIPMSTYSMAPYYRT